MKKHLNYLFLVIVLSFIVVTVRYNKARYVSSSVWKYHSGTASGDLLEFKTTADNELEQIAIDEAVVVFCFGTHLFVKNKLTNKYGYYIAKSGFEMQQAKLETRNKENPGR